MFVLPPFIWGLVELYTMQSTRRVHIISLWVNVVLLIVAAGVCFVLVKKGRLNIPKPPEIRQLGFGLFGNVLIYLYTFQNLLKIQDIVTIYLVLFLVLIAHYVLVKRRMRPLELWMLMPLFIVIDYAHLLVSGCGYMLFDRCDPSGANYWMLYLLYVSIVLGVFGYYGYRIVTYRRRDVFGILNLVLVVSLMFSLQTKLDVDEKIIGTLLILIFFFILLDLIVSIVNKTFSSRIILFYMRTMTVLFVWFLMMNQDFFNYGSPGRDMLVIMVVVTYVSLGINVLKGLLHVEERYEVKRKQVYEIVPFEEGYENRVKAFLSRTSDERVLPADESLDFIALKHDGIVGFIQVSLRALPKPVEETEAYVQVLETDPDDEEREIAGHLIDRVIEDGKPFGITQIRAWSAIDREESILFWKEKGFMLCHAIRFEQERSGDIEGFYAVKKV
jgi:GNAT superfamily N-acetyltransferase